MRTTPPLTKEDLAAHEAYCRALDPDGAYGDRILSRHLRLIDETKHLCKQNPAKPRGKAAIAAALAACVADQQLISAEAQEARARTGIKSPFSDL